MSRASPWAGSASAPRKGPGLGTALLVLVCLAILIGLGVWQLQRLKWKENLLSRIAARNGIGRLSMGMSADFETAVRFGATSVRVGSALFGDRTG